MNLASNVAREFPIQSHTTANHTVTVSPSDCFLSYFVRDTLLVTKSRAVMKLIDLKCFTIDGPKGMEIDSHRHFVNGLLHYNFHWLPRPEPDWFHQQQDNIFWKSKEDLDKTRHMIATFEDGVFECLCESAELVGVTQGNRIQPSVDAHLNLPEFER